MVECHLAKVKVASSNLVSRFWGETPEITKAYILLKNVILYSIVVWKTKNFSTILSTA